MLAHFMSVTEVGNHLRSPQNAKNRKRSPQNAKVCQKIRTQQMVY